MFCMHKYILFAYLCLACTLPAVAQKNAKYNKLGLAWQMPDNWKLAPEKNSDTRFYAYPSEGTAAIDIRLVTDSDPAKATVGFMQENIVPPTLVSGQTPRNVQQGKLTMQVFEKDGIDMKLDNGTELGVNRKLIIAQASNGKRYLIYFVEHYKKGDAKQAKNIENILKSFKVK